MYFSEGGFLERGDVPFVPVVPPRAINYADDVPESERTNFEIPPYLETQVCIQSYL